MIDKSIIEELKNIPITDYLNQIGCQPVRKQGKELVYYSPRYQENSPSFMVEPVKNVFHDFSGMGEKGDIIRLVQYLQNCSFGKAVQILKEFAGSSNAIPFSFSGQNLNQVSSNSSLEIISVLSIQNRALMAYIKSRKISNEVASQYLKEIHYRVNKKHFYAIGFPNDKGGFELRSLYFKGGTSPKYFTTISGKPNGAINVFEGFFDFLTCCQHHNTIHLKNPTIVLNTLSLLQGTLPILRQYQLVNTFFDNDKAGKRANEKLRAEDLQVNDCSSQYASFKDYNEYYVQNHN
ncbi:toprim domain-containing protein [Larkinella humicola]|uniref:Mobilization protein n=1 Tax=Larkinella humicola TaxID=2607654 RepID=A0A5N1JB62_9BACT|nr:toprim domain-containing protein [Larkinella humicola]KAA9349721.1 mobilization protein [Larkinella humicola]